MKAFSTVSALSAIFAGLTSALPLDMDKRNNVGFSQVDITILQFALTLEHLENTFYKDAFRAFRQEDFIAAGFDDRFYANLQFIAADESAHVQFLSAAIQSAGFTPVQPCIYNFPVTDIASFVTLSAVLESIGTSAYLGAAPFISSKQILNVAASVMAVEGLHTSLQRSSLGAIGAPSPFVTPLDPNSVFSLASQFIVSCPPSNPPLPFSSFPGLTVSGTPCFNEVVGINSQGGFATQSVNWVSAVSQANNAEVTSLETATETTTAESATETATETATESATEAATETATETAAAESVTETATATETTSAEATETPAPEKRGLEARQFNSNCNPFFGGNAIDLMPDFSRATHIDFRRIQVIFVTIISGLDVISIQAVFRSDGSINIVIPPSIGGGQIFIFITTIDVSGRSLGQNDILFGPAVFELAPAFPSVLI